MFTSQLTYLLLWAAAITPGQACFGNPHGPRKLTRRGNSTTPVGTRVQPAAPTARVAIQNVRVFDGQTILEPSTVVMDGTLISGDIATKVDSTIDGKNGILMPGLIDSHAHPSTLPNLETYSQNGVTTVMNMGCQNYANCNAMRDQLGLTTYYTAGQQAQGPNSTHAIQWNTPPNRLIWSPQQAPEFVWENFSNGSDYLKITAERNGPDQATQNALVEQAHALGKKVMTHAADLKSFMQAINSLSDAPQHMPTDGLFNSTYTDLMKKNKQFTTPTCAVFRAYLDSPDAATIFAGQNMSAVWPQMMQNVGILHDAGIPILAGTDAVGDADGVNNPFGSTLHDELYYLVQGGLSPLEALRAATANPSKYHELNDRGHVAPGLRADLVLLQPDAEPLSCINDTRKIARVWNGGLEYKLQ